MAFLSEDVLMECAREYGTPIYLYSYESIKAQYESLRDLINIGCKIHYSIKSNPTLAILRVMKEIGANCDASSKNEISMALYAGFSSDQIIFVGPGKTEDEISYAIQSSIKYIICESVEEILYINKISAQKNIKTNILLRINPNFIVNHSAMKMTGSATQFGIDEAILSRYIEELMRLSNINIKGIQVYNGTRILEGDSIVCNTKAILNLYLKLQKKYNLTFECVDIGGGFGIPYFDDENEIDLNKMISGLKKEIQNFRKNNGCDEIIIELGRFLIAKSGCLITKIVNRKISHNKEFLILDGGMHCHSGISLQGSFIHKNFPVQLINNLVKSDDEKKFQITGPSCSPGDLLGRDVLLPKASIGDYLVFLRVGAYGLTASPGHFIGHGMPAEVMYRNGKFTLIRKKEDFEDLIKTQITI